MSGNILLKQEELDEKSSSFKEPSSFKIRQNKVAPSENKPLTLREEMRSLKTKFSGGDPVTITTPFQGTALGVYKDQSSYVFPSKEGRVAICKAEDKSLIADKDLKQGNLWTLALYANDTRIIAAGSGRDLKKIELPSLKVLDNFQGHTGEVNYVLVSPDEKWVYSGSDDSTVRMWDLNDSSIASQVLYSHSSNVYGMDLSIDGIWLASVGGDSNMIVYQLQGDLEESKNITKKIKVCNDTLWICRFSPDIKLLVAGSEDSNSYVYNTSSWELVKVLRGHEARVRCMNFLHDSSALITGGIDKLIKVWDMKTNKDSITLKHHTDWVRATIISPDNDFCVSLGDDYKIIRWRVPSFDRQTSLKSDNATVTKMWTSKDSSTIYGITATNIVRSWSALTGEQLKEFSIPFNDIAHIATSSGLDSIYIFTYLENPFDPDDYVTKIALISADSGTILKNFEVKGLEIISSLASRDEKFFCVGTKFTLEVFSQSFYPIYTFRAHTSQVNCMALTQNSEYLFSADSDGGLLISSIDNKQVIKKLREPVEWSNIFQLKVSRSDTYLYVVHSLFLEIYSIPMKSKLYTIKDPDIKHVNFSLDDSKLFCFDRNSLNIYNTQNFTLFYTQTFRAPTSYITFSNDSTYYVLYRGSISKITENPLLLSHHCCLGKNDEIDDYEKYIVKIIRHKCDKHIKKFDKWIIMPNYMNTCHFYAYYNMPEYLEKAYKEDAPFFASRSGETPLSIALKRKYVGCTRAIIKGLSMRLKENPLNFYFFENAITDLTLLGFGGLHRLFNYMYSRSFNRALPKFATNKISPIVRQGNSLILDPNNFINSPTFPKDGTAIVFQQSYCKLPLVPGSQASLNLLDALSDCSNKKIYEVEIIQIILQEKWKSVRFVMFIQAIIYMTYAVLLAIYSINHLNDKTFIIAPMAVQGILFSYEIFQICAYRLDYFKSPSNLIDLTSCSLFIAYFVMIQLSNFNNSSLFSIVLFITFLRGVTYFQIFEDTRYYIILLYEVIPGVLPFLIILYYSQIGFAMIFLALDRSQDSVFADYAASTYPSNLNIYPNTNFDYADWLTFFSVTLLISIIMFNLVVNILAHTYKAVKKNSILADSQSLVGMIYEVELMQFWNRKKNIYSFLYRCYEKPDNAIEKVEISVKVQNLKANIGRLAKKVNNNQKLLRNLRRKYIESSDRIWKSVREILA